MTFMRMKATCGIYPDEERTTEILRVFGIPKPKVPFCVIAIGTPDQAPTREVFSTNPK
jgi:hypothetical protein